MKFFKPLFESIRDYRKIVLISFSSESDLDFLNECGILKKDV